MDKINEISGALQVLILIGCTMRIIYCLIRMPGAENEEGMYKKRIVNTIKIAIITQLAFVIKDVAITYFGGV